MTTTRTFHRLASLAFALSGCAAGPLSCERPPPSPPPPPALVAVAEDIRGPALPDLALSPDLAPASDLDDGKCGVYGGRCCFGDGGGGSCQGGDECRPDTTMLHCPGGPYSVEACSVCEHPDCGAPGKSCCLEGKPCQGPDPFGGACVNGTCAP